DMEGKVTTWNHGAEMMFGYESAEIVGQPVTLISPDNHKEQLTKIREIALTGKGVAGYETLRKRKDGSLFEVSASVSPIKDFLGKVVGVSAILRDITERKEAEAVHEKQQEQIR